MAAYNEIGVISDTHGLIRPQVLSHLMQCDAVIHAGDIGHPRVVKALSKVGPTLVIRGNVDRGDWADTLPNTLDLLNHGHRIHVLHNIGMLDRTTLPAETKLVISGHSHIPKCRQDGKTVYLNPGSIGPRRFKLPIAWNRIRFENDEIDIKAFHLVEGCVMEVNPWKT